MSDARDRSRPSAERLAEFAERSQRIVQAFWQRQAAATGEAVLRSPTRARSAAPSWRSAPG